MIARALTPIAICLLVCVAPDAATAAAMNPLASGSVGPTKWEVTSPFGSMPAVGYVPLTVTATNSGTKEIRASYDLALRSYGFNETNASLAAGSLRLPVGRSVGATHWVWLGSKYQEGHSSRWVDFSLSTPQGNSNDSIRSGNRGGSRAGLTVALGNRYQSDNTTTFAAKALPPDWRVFSSLHTIFFEPSDWDDFSPGVRDALRTWIGFGGVVRVVANHPDDAAPVIAALASPETSRLFAAPNPVQFTRKATLAGGTVDRASGIDTVFRLGAPSAFNTNNSRAGRQARYRSNNYEEPRGFPLRDDFGRRDIPYFFICMLLIVFAVLVGPVSLKLWAGPGRRHRLFFITPVLSIGASGLMLLLMLFQDGLGIDGRRFVVMDLAPAGASQPNALIYQEQFSRAGMIAKAGFKVEDGLLPIAGNSWTRESIAVRDGRAVGGWFSSRRDRSMVLAGTAPVRWEVTHAGASEDSLTLRIESPLSGFKSAWFVDDAGVVWKWDGSAPDTDGRMRFIQASRDSQGVMSPMFSRCSDQLRTFILDRAAQENQRNRFWALVPDGSAAARATHPKIDWKESNLILTSKVTPQSNG